MLHVELLSYLPSVLEIFAGIIISEYFKVTAMSLIILFKDTF